MSMLYSLNDRSARRYPISLHLRRGWCSPLPLGPLGIDMAPDLDLLLLDDGGAAAGPLDLQ